MVTRFTYKALSIAALGIALGLSLPATITEASTTTEEALALEPPAAPSHVKAWKAKPDPKWPYQILYFATWRDNSSNEDGFILEEWRKESGVWVLAWTTVTPANATSVLVDGNGPSYRFRVKAFNAAGESAWSNWGN